jgi:hypothetical protein
MFDRLYPWNGLILEPLRKGRNFGAERVRQVLHCMPIKLWIFACRILFPDDGDRILAWKWSEFLGMAQPRFCSGPTISRRERSYRRGEPCLPRASNQNSSKWTQNCGHSITWQLAFILSSPVTLSPVEYSIWLSISAIRLHQGRNFLHAKVIAQSQFPTIHLSKLDTHHK